MSLGKSSEKHGQSLIEVAKIDADKKGDAGAAC